MGSFTGIGQTHGPSPLGAPKKQTPADILKDKGPSFSEHLKQQSPINEKLNGAQTAVRELKFSNHAIERMRSRGLVYTPEQLKKIEAAVTKADAKGSRETLVLTDDSALVVSVKNKTVVTVMDQTNMKENVFTNIDSTVMI